MYCYVNNLAIFVKAENNNAFFSLCNLPSLLAHAIKDGRVIEKGSVPFVLILNQANCFECLVRMFVATAFHC